MAIKHTKPFEKIAILGLGRSGMAVLSVCHENAIQAVIYDDRNGAEKSLSEADKALFCHYEQWNWTEIDALIISPGIAHNHPVPHPAAATASKADIPVISEVEFALRMGRKGRWVTITGTNGKSTTTALIGHILKIAKIKHAVGGNIGAAVTALPCVGEDGVNVIELSSYQLETTPSLSADITVLLNITADHLDRHGGLDGYIAAKEQALISTKDNGVAIIGNGPVLDRLADRHQQRLSVMRLYVDEIEKEEQSPAKQNNLALSGKHNAENSLAARLVCQKLGLENQQIDTAIASFAGLPHRLQPTGQIGHILFINDSKATNGTAAARALAAYKNIHWCAGGLAKEDGLDACLAYLGHVTKGYLYGKAADEFSRILNGKLCVSCHETLDQAVRAASQSAQRVSRETDELQVILLSPAAASFDQFSSFEERGEKFCALVAEEIEHIHHNMNILLREDSHV